MRFYKILNVLFPLSFRLSFYVFLTFCFRPCFFVFCKLVLTERHFKFLWFIKILLSWVIIFAQKFERENFCLRDPTSLTIRLWKGAITIITFQFMSFVYVDSDGGWGLLRKGKRSGFCSQRFSIEIHCHKLRTMANLQFVKVLFYKK